MTDQLTSTGGCTDEQIMAATPEQLTLMLYNGAISFIDESVAALGQKDFEKSHKANLRVQGIIREFMATLDFQYEVSKNLMSLYEYMENRLQTVGKQENQNQEGINQLKEVRALLTELRDTWEQAISIRQ